MVLFARGAPSGAESAPLEPEQLIPADRGELRRKAKLTLPHPPPRFRQLLLHSWRDMDIQCLSEQELPFEIAEQIQLLQQAAFGQTAEFTRQRWWHTPHGPGEMWFLATDGLRLIGSVRLIERRIRTTCDSPVIGGIGNVCSHPEARGLGAAKRCLQSAGEYIRASLDFGVLMCSDNVRELYAKLGWQVVTNDFTCVNCQGSEGPYEVKPGNYVMILPGRRKIETWPPGPINLCGQDW